MQVKLVFLIENVITIWASNVKAKVTISLIIGNVVEFDPFNICGDAESLRHMALIMRVIHCVLWTAGFWQLTGLAFDWNTKTQQSSNCGLFVNSSLFFWEPFEHNETFLPFIDS